MKKVFFIICAVAIIAAAGVNVSVGLNGEKSKFSDLTLKNIEALGQYTGGESTGGGSSSSGCDTYGWIVGGYYFLKCVTGSNNSCLSGSLTGTVSTIQCKN
ncbi:hypothetical protein FACS189464_3460 [Bacteroidia bacterium]|nr:hypothetical protein FACS189464_3460 [Bacteroidia bacterium]